MASPLTEKVRRNGRAEVTGEHVAPVDADPQWQHTGAVEDLARHAQHPLLVVVGAARAPLRQHDLAAVAVDVGLEEA